MKKAASLWKVIVVDILGVILIILAILTGWLPGPGGIPLFLAGLGLLAINHEWARRLIKRVQSYSSQAGSLIFKNDPKIQLLYDLLVPVLTLCGLILLIQHNALWLVSLGVILLAVALTFFFGNRHRLAKLKRILKQLT